ncbi:PUF nine target 1 [Trypanosoma grayi]|uniref:PUF nine target 1 n=1 Tax=Trypanosoma grayi TaxID=71804 RepID=UPI0004F47AAF|nr:PUF nine target 1 [Trypanosoma grayi]KEG13171.1 PUF nine target 1 [Trypanosoma grayi]
MSAKASRRCNRLIVLFSSINDVTAWPFWKFLQMKKVKGVTDLSILAFNSQGGSFEARIDGQEYTLKNYESVAGYRQDMLERFLHRWYDPGRSYFVYGGHGMGDYLELEKNTMGLQCHELAAILGDKKFEAIVFDACFMASLECAYHLRHNTRYIGGCEGYLWEPDTSLDHHVFNTYTASAMSRFRDPKHILLAVQRDYCSKSPLADFAVLDTTHVEALRNYVEEHVVQRVYDRATFYNIQQQHKLSSLAEEALQTTLQSTNSDIKTPLSSPDTVAFRAMATKVQNKKLARKLQLQQSVQFEHALYPSETSDKYILDLKSYLTDMAREEEEAAVMSVSSAVAAAAAAATGTAAPQLPRTAVVEAQGSLPPEKRHHPRFAKGSAHEGLELFNRVVINHTPPENKHIYASHLGGLSFPVYEFSTMSKPLHPWKGVNKDKFMQKAKEFLRRGAVQEVQMRDRSNISKTKSDNLTRETEAGVCAPSSVSSASSSAPPLPAAYLPLLCHNSKINTPTGGGVPEPRHFKINQ